MDGRSNRCIPSDYPRNHGGRIGSLGARARGGVVDNSSQVERHGSKQLSEMGQLGNARYDKDPE